MLTGQSFPTDGHKTILNRINNKSKTNKKQTNIDNKNKTQQKHRLWHSLRFSQHIINHKILKHPPEKTVSQQQKTMTMCFNLL